VHVYRLLNTGACTSFFIKLPVYVVYGVNGYNIVNFSVHGRHNTDRLAASPMDRINQLSLSVAHRFQHSVSLRSRRPSASQQPTHEVTLTCVDAVVGATVLHNVRRCLLVALSATS